ncbi:MAG: hypothetical protein RBR59_03920 [Sulfurimonadaceae bacterium]|nr:hypothetical protein [Sulfurimonadaceae bacterium]
MDDNISDLDVIVEAKIDLKESVLSQIMQENEKIGELMFINSLSQPIDEEKIKDMYCPNAIGFLATEENLEDEEFVGYIHELMVSFPDVEFKGFYFIDEQKKNALETFNTIECIPISSIYNITNKIEIFVWGMGNNLDVRIALTILKNFNQIFPIYNFYNPYFLNLQGKTLKDYDDFYKERNEVILTNPKSVGFTDEEILKNGDSYCKLIYNSLMSRELNTQLEIDLNSDALEFLLFTQLEFVLHNKTFKKDFIKMHQLRNFSQ